MGDAGRETGDETGDDPLDGGPDRPRGAPPHPLDRVWLHPSELASFAAATPAPSRPRPMWTATVVAGAAGAILTLGVLSAMGAIGSSRKAPDNRVATTSTPVVTAQALAISVGPAVVAVSVHESDRTRRGSGVCISRAGEVLTSDRLVGNATSLDVTTADGQRHAARVVGRDAATDLVLLRLDATLPTAPFASAAPDVADTVWVVAAPDAGDRSPWMSSGDIASTDGLVAAAAGPTTSGLLETAAPSGAAASGAALVDRSGAVTGIVLWPVGNGRMTYAIPIRTALAIAAGLERHGYVAHGALGIAGTDELHGPTVTELVKDGPAARAGVRVGDVVSAVDRREVETMAEIMALVRHDRPGREIALALRRGTRTLTVHAVLAGVVAP